MDADAIISGAGPSGLLLAAELRLAGARPLVLERQPEINTTPKANGVGGQILQLLRYRGLLDRLEAATTAPTPRPVYPWGDVHLDLTRLADPPLRGLPLPQPELERALDEHARELGAEVRRGHELLGFVQDETSVTADVRGPDGAPYQLTARYLVGCDGPHGIVRETAGIAFPGTTYPEVNRLGQTSWPESVTLLDNGDLEVPGLGRLRRGWTRTDAGLFGFGGRTSGGLMVSTTEDESTHVDDDVPMTLAELQASIRRVLGGDLPLGEPFRLSRFTFQSRQAERYRDRRILLAGDAAHLYPATGVALNVGMQDVVNLAWKLAADIHGWAPPGLLDTYHDERRFVSARTMMQTQAQVAVRRGHDAAAEALRDVLRELLGDEQPAHRLAALIAGTDIRYPSPDPDTDPNTDPNQHALTGTFAPDLPLRADGGKTSVAALMHPARPILLDLADRPDLRGLARPWQDRVEIHAAETDHRPADALLIRPDAYIAWAAGIDEPADTAAPALRQALSSWFGAPSLS
jgi:2-polyprenyl-6-methoxyphenol hydroxylase-like FAD-dependent oxidoreductase